MLETGDMYAKVKPSEEALGRYLVLTADMFDPDSFLRSTGDAVARYDTAWKTVCVHKEAKTVINQAVADFLLIGLAHLDAVAMNRMHRTGMATMLSLLVSVDMSGADTCALGENFLELHSRFLKACIEFRMAVADDDFSRRHADAILGMEARLYEDVLKAFVAAYSPLSGDMAYYEGAGRSAVKYIAEHPVATGGVNPDPAAPSESLVDMFSRLHALGMQD